METIIKKAGKIFFLGAIAVATFLTVFLSNIIFAV